MTEDNDPKGRSPAGGDNEGVSVNPVALDELLPEVGEAATAAAADPRNKLDLVMDVEVPVMVSVGRVKKTISEVLSLGEGHVIDLERTAGEPVDLLVNGKLIARGEVVVVDEHYGLRISEIVSPSERLGNG